MMQKRSSGSIDRITNLPDCLKTKILSCLPIKDAARTSVLSTEWKESWTCSTNLDFGINFSTSKLGVGEDSENFVEGFGRRAERDSQSFIRYFYARARDSEGFVSFVNRVLRLRGRSYIQRFSMIDHVILSKTPESESPIINAWLAAVALCNVKEIIVSVMLNSHINLDLSIFHCATLVILKLKLQGYLDIPSPVSLPCLRTLHLEDIKFQDCVSLRRLISGCPVLEELNLCCCFGDEVEEVNIRAHALTSLTIKHVAGDSEYDCFYYEIVVDAPSLRYFNIKDGKAVTYELVNLCDLMEAVIDIGPPDESRFEDYEDDEEYRKDRAEAITKLLNGVFHVQRLVLSWESLQIIHWCDAVLPTFSNLAYLEVSMSCEIGWGLLPKLLENSPHLKTLHLKQETEFKDSGHCVSLDDVATCLLSHLKVIQIDDFRGLENEMQMIEYFLLNAKVLEKLTIAYQSCSKNKDQSPSKNTEECSKLLKKLQSFPRSSATCKFEVS